METAGEGRGDYAGENTGQPRGPWPADGAGNGYALPARRPEVPDPGWRVGRFLGAGGAAGVWLVERTEDGTRYALKMPHSPEAAADGFDLRRELTILSRFRHENLLGVHGLLTTDSGPGLLLEYAPGDSLARLVEVKQTLSAGEAVTVLVAVARALACLHAEGTAHGDVSPGNVLFTAYGKPLLADFGTSRMLGERRDSRVGTPGFSAPAASGGDGLQGSGAGLEADVYAVGALGWFMLTGRPLVPGLRPPLSVVLPGLPVELRKLLDAALDDDPARRPAAETFAAEVFRAWPAEPIDLLASVHPSIRPELRTRRSANAPVKTRKGLLWPGKRRRSRKPPWEEPARRGRKGHPGQAAGQTADTQRSPGRRSHRGPVRARAPVHSARTPAWLSAAVVFVALTAVLGGVSVLAPEVLRPAKEVFLPASNLPPANPPDGPGTDGQPTEAELSVLADGDPVAAVRVLSAVRARAYAEGNPALLGWVNQPDSAAGAADLAQVELLSTKGERLSGLSVEVVLAEHLGSSGGPEQREQVLVTARNSAFVQVGAGGAPTAGPGAAGQQELVLELVETDQGWRIARVLPVAAGLEPGGSAQR